MVRVHTTANENQGPLSYNNPRRVRGTGDQWSFYRKHISPTFKSTNHALLMPVINKHVQIFAQCLQKKADATTDEFNVRPIVGRYVIDAIMGEFEERGKWVTSRCI